MGNKTEVKYRIPVEKRRDCLECFLLGYGYKRTATTVGLSKYTVREYMRKHIDGDDSWADADGDFILNLEF